jgi:hypothetical protein
VAVISGDRSLILIELDGCRRILALSGFLGTADDQLVDALSS